MEILRNKTGEMAGENLEQVVLISSSHLGGKVRHAFSFENYLNEV